MNPKLSKESMIDESCYLTYRIVINCPDKEVAEKMFEEIRKSKTYNSKEIVNLNRIKIVCLGCEKK